MMDVSDLLDNGSNFPETWKTLVRELLLKFEDGCTYHHNNIVGCRPYHVDLKIIIDGCVPEEVDKRLHDEANERKVNAFMFHEVFLELLDIVSDNDLLTDELKDNLKELGVMES